MTASIPVRHTKLHFPQGARRFPVYASHYRFGSADLPAPLIVYVGGVTPLDAYLERLETEPVLIRDQVIAALQTHPVPALDVLVCPFPQDTQDSGSEWFLEHFDDELAPALGATPTALGFFGYSAGSTCAFRTGVFRNARAIALMGSAGVEREMVDPDIRLYLERAARTGAWTCDVGIYRNEDDFSKPAPVLAARLVPPLRALPGTALPGGHPFAGYVKNGTVPGVFRFLVGALRT